MRCPNAPLSTQISQFQDHIILTIFFIKCLDGVYLMEIDRVLRPGGYWVVSGPPISWKSSYKGWERKAQDLEKEQISLEDLARRLCWKKIAERGPIAVWRKPTNHIHCIQKLKAWKSPHFCAETDPDAGW